LTTLPDEQRDAFLLREEGGLNVDQIAAVTGCNRETAKSRLRYAVAKLRSAIDEPAERS
jgi:RNA polymerase sigma-70 factor (ECF subfamily)